MRVTIGNIVDVNILGLACELGQGLTSASLGHIHTPDGPRCLKHQVPLLVLCFSGLHVVCPCVVDRKGVRSNCSGDGQFFGNTISFFEM